jgi:hypothetical protein
MRTAPRGRWYCQNGARRSHTLGSLTVRLDDSTLDELAVAVAAQLAALSTGEGFLNSEAAAAYLGVTRKRIHDLRSAGALKPDGFDGRTPLYTRQTLDAYARS